MFIKLLDKNGIIKEIKEKDLKNKDKLLKKIIDLLKCYLNFFNPSFYKSKFLFYLLNIY